jgi:putative tricarboxylic transport membrane protein
MFDVYVMFGAGILGYIMLRNDFPTSPIALALLLGTNMEKAMSLTRTMYEGELHMIFTRPLTTALALFTVFSFAFPLAKIYIEKKRKAKAAQAEKAE